MLRIYTKYSIMYNNIEQWIIQKVIKNRNIHFLKTTGDMKHIDTRESFTDMTCISLIRQVTLDYLKLTAQFIK